MRRETNAARQTAMLHSSFYPPVAELRCTFLIPYSNIFSQSNILFLSITRELIKWKNKIRNNNGKFPSTYGENVAEYVGENGPGIKRSFYNQIGIILIAADNRAIFVHLPPFERNAISKLKNS